jgi:hypothetical protein
MTLTKDRIGEIAMAVLQRRMEGNGIELKPSEVKRETANSAKKLGIPEIEIAEFTKIIITEAFNKTVAKLDEMIDGKVE